MAQHLCCALLVSGVLGCSLPSADSPESAQAQARSSSGPALVLAGVTVIDGTGGPALADQTVIVRGGLIERVVPASEEDLENSGARILAEPGRFLMPGLWDSHAHSFARLASLELNLLHGVTTIRDMGCDPECSEALRNYRDAFGNRTGPGPRLLVAGPNIDGTSPIDYSGHVHVSVNSARAEVERRHSEGSDFVKVRDWLSLEEHRAVFAAALEFGLGHSQHPENRCGGFGGGADRSLRTRSPTR